MATRQMSTIFQHLRRAALSRGGAGMTDGQLLESFIAEKDEAAFAALVHRHGPMVLAVCNRVLNHHHDAEDAFQATFLVFARKASSVRPRERVANWLHGVAYRTALKARTMKVKAQVRERQVTDMPEPAAAQQDHWSDLQPLLDEELGRLPETYRLALLLCDLEGKSIREATRQLGWPQGTLASRLARARKMLAKRLTQRGVVLSNGSLAVMFSESAASASVPPSLAGSTVKAAVAIAAGQTAATGTIPAHVAALMEGVLKGMMLTKLKAVTTVLLVLGMVSFGGGLLALHRAAAEESRVGKETAEDKKGGADAAKKDARTVPGGLTETATDTQLEENGPVTVILDNCKIVVEARTKLRLRPAKTEKGNGVRLEIPGVTVEVLRLKIESATRITEIEGAEGGVFTVQTFAKGKAKVEPTGKGPPKKPAASEGRGAPDLPRPEADTANDVVEVNARDMGIPVVVGKNAVDLKQLHLFASADQGGTWKQVGTISPADSHFKFSAPEDGLYWLAVQTVSKNGKVEPRDLRTLQQMIKIRVKTSQFPLGGKHPFKYPLEDVQEPQTAPKAEAKKDQTTIRIGDVSYTVPFPFPSSEEILRSLPNATSPPKDARIHCELIRYQLDEPRFFPQVGPARLAHAHFKCTVVSDQGLEVVYIDRDHLISVR